MKSALKTYMLLLIFITISCKNESKTDQENLHEYNSKKPSTIDDSLFTWEAANLYFLLIDRFKNGDPNNDIVLGRTKKTPKLKGFEGGDIKGIIQKIEDGYFKKLGVNAIGFNPVVEQIHENIKEGTENTYAFHGYWIKDWTKVDPNFGTYNDFKQLIETAHNNGIRIIMDVVMNHTGPVTSKDPVWPDSWVRTSQECNQKDYTNTISCSLGKKLPDIKTESNENVALPKILLDKWKSEERLEIELAEIDTFFNKTRLKRSPKNYIIKWLTDYIRELGIDGYRIKNVKHVEESSWNTLAEQSKLAFIEWKSKNADKVLDDNEFYILGELYGYSIKNKRYYNFEDRKIDYFAYGIDSMVNFQFKYDATQYDYEKLFSKYSTVLYTNLIGKSVVNYISYHNDRALFDKNRSKAYESAIKLILTPGISQIYYGNEVGRLLDSKEAKEPPTLISNMDWNTSHNNDTKLLLSHWQKLGVFRKNHISIGAGRHQILSEKPYIFSREYDRNGIFDKVIIGLNLPKGKKSIKVKPIFSEGTILIDQYSGSETKVHNDSITISSDYEIVLLANKDN
ncbi:alpha-amylase family glycosyl hydrolase [Aquimarina longa]|uniref:alpha-amylase family glycosyl hydrolase n=1 Tax=Aquimarina longa TaxID=1080221 RepID=UPI000781414D|nr:alpha-amylase family glycosyl hydrolase [Aquimarina longa]